VRILSGNNLPKSKQSQTGWIRLRRIEICASVRGNIGASHIHYAAVDWFSTKELSLQVVDLGKGWKDKGKGGCESTQLPHNSPLRVVDLGKGYKFPVLQLTKSTNILWVKLRPLVPPPWIKSARWMGGDQKVLKIYSIASHVNTRKKIAYIIMVWSVVPHCLNHCALPVGHNGTKKCPFSNGCDFLSEANCCHVLVWYCTSRVALFCNQLWV